MKDNVTDILTLVRVFNKVYCIMVKTFDNAVGVDKNKVLSGACQSLTIIK